MENSLLQTLKAEQEEAVKKLESLFVSKTGAKANYDAAKSEYDEQKKTVDQNARALKAFEPRKTRQKKQELRGA
jgi:hypothetical protein